MPSSDLTWTQANSPVNRIDQYRVYRSDNVLTSSPLFADSFVLIATLPVVQDPEFPFGEVHPLAFSDTAVDFSMDFYCYRVDAFSVLVGEATGGSPQTGVGPSNIICIGTPAQPATLSGLQITDFQVDLSWVNGAAGILPVFSTCIFRSVNGGAFALLAEVFEPTTTFSDTTVDLSGTNTYEYFVTSKDEVGIESLPSNTVDFGFAEDILIAVANSGATGRRIMVSVDGDVWEQKQIVDENWQDIAFAPDQGLLGAGRIVATNFGGAIATAYYSDDGGESWNPGTTVGGTAWNSVAYSQALGRWAAISGNANTNGNKVMTSDDGATWVFRSTPVAMDGLAWAAITYDAVNGLFIAGSNTIAASSPDGITWTERATPGTAQITDQIATDLTGVSVGANRGDVSNLRTVDGVTWIEVNPNGWPGGAVGMAFGAGLFVAAQGGAQGMETSPDGTANWINRTIPPPGNLGTWEGITFSVPLALFCAVNSGNFPDQVITSVDGITWVNHDVTGNVDAAWRAITPALRPTNLALQEMVMVENNAASPNAGLSNNGTQWVVNATAFPFRLDDVAWSTTLGLYAAVGDNVCITSPDGITWTPRTVPSIFDWQTVMYSTGLSLFIAGADESGTGSIMTSTDGITWIQRTTSNGWRCHDIVEHPTANSGSPRILAVGLHGFTNPTGNMTFSNDGITWTDTATNPSNRVVACAYDSTLDRVVVIETGGQCNVSSDCDTFTLNINSADIGSGNASNSSALGYSAALDQLVFVSGNGVFSSEDGGANFTLRDAAGAVDVKFSTVLGKWIAINGAGTRLRTSVDGITWIAQPDPAGSADTWHGLALGDEI